MSWWKRNQAANPAAEDDTVEMPPQADAALAADARHPVLTAALAAGVTTKADFDDMHATATAAREEMQASCLREAVRCFGPETGPAKAKALDGQSYTDAKAMRDIWRETADAKFGTTEAQGAERQTASVARAEDSTANATPGAKEAPKYATAEEIYAMREKQGG